MLVKILQIIDQIILADGVADPDVKTAAFQRGNFTDFLFALKDGVDSGFDVLEERFAFGSQGYLFSLYV